MKGASSDVQVYPSKIHSLSLLTLLSHRLLSRYRLIVAENPQAKAPVLFQVLLLLRIVRLELTINKINPLDFGLGVDNKPQLRAAIGLYLSHETQPPKRTREGPCRPLPLHSILQHGVDLLQPHRQANLGDVLVPPTVLVRKLDVGPERGVPAIQRAVLDVVHVHAESQPLILPLLRPGRHDVQVAVERLVLLEPDPIRLFAAAGVNPITGELVDDGPHTVGADEELARRAVLEQHFAKLLELVFGEVVARVVVLGLDELKQAAGHPPLVQHVLLALAKQQRALDVQAVLQSLIPTQTSALRLAGPQRFPLAG